MSTFAMRVGVAPRPVPVARESHFSFQDEKTLAFETRLQQSGYQALRNLTVVVCDGLVVLGGTVDSYFLKQMAQEAIRPLAIGLQITNEIQVSSQSR